MKFIVIGLGSMGKRRIRCLLELGISKENILGYDLKEERRNETNEVYGIITMPKFTVMKDWVMLVCTPPDKHLEYLQIASDYKIPCFVEASVCIERLREIKNKEYIYPSATMRFNGDVSYLNNLFKKRKCIKFEYKCSSYLPDWHPHEDIKDFYVSKKETGACREMVPFELEWLIWIFGKIKQIKGIVRSTGTFGEIDDIYQILLEFESGVVGYVLIDIITKEAKGGYRKIKFNLIGDVGSYETEIRIKESMYVEEMRHFVEAVENNNYHYSVEEDIKILELLEKIEK